MNIVNYENDKKINKDHVATPRWVVENIYDLIDIKAFNNIWFPFNNYDSHFSQQNEIIKKTFELIEQKKIKSFCLLLPLATLETPTRAEIYEKYVDKLSILIFKKRIKFLNTNGSFNKGCCWVCYNIPNLDKKLYWI